MLVPRAATHLVVVISFVKLGSFCELGRGIFARFCECRMLNQGKFGGVGRLELRLCALRGLISVCAQMHRLYILCEYT